MGRQTIEQALQPRRAGSDSEVILRAVDCLRQTVAEAGQLYAEAQTALAERLSRARRLP